MAKKRKRCTERPAGLEPGLEDKEARTASAPANFAHGLRALLGDDIDVDRFRSEHFERKPLHVSRLGNGSNYYASLGDLASPEGLFELMDSGLVPVYRMNMFRCRDGSTKETPNPPPQSVADVRRLFGEGWSIQWLQPQQEHDALSRLVVKLEAEFGSLVGVNAYLTPPGTQGLAPHWDDVEVFVLQLGGRKSWRLHASTTALPSPPEAQTLPRHSSGDLELASLSPVMMQPKLKPGDMLYFPRGTIHYAPNHDSKEPSVHLTISTFQQQTLYDLTQKTFEEVMSEFWEEDEELRRALPWRSFAPGASSYSVLCSSVAQWLRKTADAIEAEAGDSKHSSDGGGGCVAAALADLGQEFVKHRMPPLSAGCDSITIATPASTVLVVDPGAFALIPLPGTEDDEEGSAKLVHHVSNSRRNHMMNHPGGKASDDDRGESENGESELCQEEEEEADEEEAREDDEGAAGDDDSGQIVSRHVASALRCLCSASSAKGVTLDSVFKRAGIPEPAWPEVCGCVTQLAALGLLRVSGEQPRKSKKSRKAMKKRAS